MIDQTKVQEYKNNFKNLNNPVVYKRFPEDFTMDINVDFFPMIGKK
ncbi:MAG: hypothetical protein GY834_07350 [Bacteroidetes bacterium]|nr:hypothetical protein [Bacteroidota bacterium]